MSTLSSTYYDRLIGHASTLFTNPVETENRIEDDPKIKKIKDYQTLFEQSLSGTRGSRKKFSNKRNEKNEKEDHAISGLAPRYHHSYARSLPYTN